MFILNLFWKRGLGVGKMEVKLKVVTILGFKAFWPLSSLSEPSAWDGVVWGSAERLEIMGSKISASELSLDQMRSYRECQWCLGKVIICFIIIHFLLFICSLRAQFEGTFKVKTKGDGKEKQSFTQEKGRKRCQFIQEATLWGDR